VMDRVTSGQLDKSGLTMRDLKRVCDSFSATLRSMMHTRIDYPKDDPGTRKTHNPSAVKRQNGNGVPTDQTNSLTRTKS